MNEITQIDQGVASLITKAEYDVQIATANKYPRSIKNFLDEARQLVTLNEDIAAQCIYSLPRAGKAIEGASARFAEIVASCWGNIRAGARIVDEDSRFITAQGVCHDLQKNVLISYEVRRRVTGNNNKKFGDDMVAVTGNAAASIALRNAILKVVPKAFWQPLHEEAKKVAIGDAKTLSSRREAALDMLQKMGVKREDVLTYLGVKGVEDITLDHLLLLRGNVTAIKEGDITVDDVFYPKKSSPINPNAGVNAVDILEQAANATQPEPATLAHDDDGVIIEQSPDSERDEQTIDMFANDAPAAEAKPIYTLEQLEQMPVKIIADRVALAKAIKASIDAGAVAKLAALQKFDEVLNQLMNDGQGNHATAIRNA
jgi:hypothetical protein